MSLLYPKESYKITGALYEVHKELGPGLLEKVYQEALEKELTLQVFLSSGRKALL